MSGDELLQDEAETGGGRIAQQCARLRSIGNTEAFHAVPTAERLGVARLEERRRQLLIGKPGQILWAADLGTSGTLPVT